jgi:hypothetical protein
MKHGMKNENTKIVRMINISDKFKNRSEFVHKCGEVLKEAKPHLVSCELKYGKDIKKTVVGERLLPDEEYVIITCENSATYNVCVEANSLIAIACDIFNKMAHK